MPNIRCVKKCVKSSTLNFKESSVLMCIKT